MSLKCCVDVVRPEETKKQRGLSIAHSVLDIKISGRAIQINAKRNAVSFMLSLIALLELMDLRFAERQRST